MSSSFLSFRRHLAITCFAALAGVAPCAAQVTPAAASTPPDDTPTIKVGVTLFADYTFLQQPKAQDADGNDVTFNAFQIGRSYVNVTGNISHSIAFRITPDIVRETGVGSSLNGSYTFRLKYAYAQWNLDDHLTRGSWARFGMQQTPWVDFIENVYRYRFQGTIFEDREGFLSSSDVGASFHYSLPQNYGDIHTGFYNGESYNKPEANDQKGWMTRGTLRPFPHAGALPLRGLRVTGFFDHDAYLKDAERRRAIVAVTFEHTYLNAAFDYLTTSDKTTAAATTVKAEGWSAWVTPRSTTGWEGLLRFDSLTPNKTIANQKKNRTIGGIAYWFPHQGAVATALLFDVDNTKFENFSPARSTQRNIAVHALVNF